MSSRAQGVDLLGQWSPLTAEPAAPVSPKGRSSRLYCDLELERFLMLDCLPHNKDVGISQIRE